MELFRGNLATKRICLTGAMLPEKFVDTDAHFNMGILVEWAKIAHAVGNYFGVSCSSCLLHCEGVCFGALDTAMPGIYASQRGILQFD